MEANSSQLVKTTLKHLHPTQITVGMIAVKTKMAGWKALPAKKREECLRSQWFPAVKGPHDRYYITDHHHVGLALRKSGVKHVQLIVQKDLSSLEPKAFWMAMDHHNWVHPYNAKGQRDDFSAIPKTLDDLEDDPFRSLADHVEKLGGYAKTSMAYAEFLWADYFRERIRIDDTREGWENAVAAAMALTHEKDAQSLPGWSGVHGSSAAKRR